MNPLQHPAPAISAATDKLAGCWKLAQGRALTLRARSGGRVTNRAGRGMDHF